MRPPHRSRFVVVVTLLAASVAAIVVPAPSARGDTITLKDGRIYQGAIERDNVLVMVFDGMRRIIVRRNRVASQVPDAGANNLEFFRLMQPVQYESGVMPEFSIGIQAGPWNDQCRREFQHIGKRNGKGVAMTQGITRLGPKSCEVRGLDHYWKSDIATIELPRPIIRGIMDKVQRDNEEERLRVARWMIQAEWYEEALAELDQLEKDFPGLKDRLDRVRDTVRSLRSRQSFDSALFRIAHGQPREGDASLRALLATATSDVLPEAKQAASKREELAADDVELIAAVRAASEGIPEESRKALGGLVIEMLSALGEVPDAARDRFGPMRKAKPEATPAQRFALAASGFLAGPDLAVEDIERVDELLKAREILRGYFRSPYESERMSSLVDLGTVPGLDQKAVIGLARGLAPPLADPKVAPGQRRTHRAAVEEGDEPVEYVAITPPEYHQGRPRPALVVLHDGQGIDKALGLWEAEAARHGYVLIAPQWLLPNQSPDYRYTQVEHAAVILALRDAKRRYAIDDDRIFLAGDLFGGNMAWDVALSHPDLWAGVGVISGLPAKFVFPYRDNTKLVPMYVAEGGMIPAAEQVILDYCRNLISKNCDMTYLDYPSRGLETLPAEAGPMLDWMDTLKRVPQRDEFEVVTAREGDDRFYNVVIRGWAAGRTIDSTAADPTGSNVKPAKVTWKISGGRNIIRLDTDGLTALDVWLSPEQVDLAKKLDVRVNGKSIMKDVPPTEIRPLLEDLRIRWDRSQCYSVKLSVGTP
jgi:pimeloyl-ACP methyl ester carboxylesterase